MPAVSKAQQRYFGMQLNKMRHGQAGDTGMSEQQVKDFASTSRKGLPARAKAAKGLMR